MKKTASKILINTTAIVWLCCAFIVPVFSAPVAMENNAGINNVITGNKTHLASSQQAGQLLCSGQKYFGKNPMDKAYAKITYDAESGVSTIDWGGTAGMTGVDGAYSLSATELLFDFTRNAKESHPETNDTVDTAYQMNIDRIFGTFEFKKIPSAYTINGTCVKPGDRKF